MALTDNVQGYWKLDESSGNAADSSGNSNTLVNSSVTYAPAKINNGGVFVALSSAKLSIADASTTGLKITGDITMAAWIYLLTTPASETQILSKFGTGGNAQNGYSISVDTSGFFNVYTDSSTDVRLRGYYASALSQNTWHYVVGVVHAGGGSIDIYVDGSAQTVTYYDQNAITINNNTQPFCIGCRTNGASFQDFFNGNIDEVGVWNRALSSTEAGQLWNGGAGLQYPFTLTTGGLAARSLNLLGVGN